MLNDLIGLRMDVIDAANASMLLLMALGVAFMAAMVYVDVQNQRLKAQIERRERSIRLMGSPDWAGGPGPRERLVYRFPETVRYERRR